MDSAPALTFRAHTADRRRRGFLSGPRLPMGLPSARARAMPSRVRSRISSRSKLGERGHDGEHETPHGAAGVEVWLGDGLEALAAGVEAFHVGEHGQDGAPRPVYLRDYEDVPRARIGP